MKTKMFICAFALGAVVMVSQNQQTTVRVKKIENKDGINKVTDTSYTLNGKLSISSLCNLASLDSLAKAKSVNKKMVIVTDDIRGDGPDVQVFDKLTDMDELIARALKAAGVNGKDAEAEKIMRINVDTKGTGINGEQGTTEVIIIKQAKITEASQADKQALGTPAGLADGKLALDGMDFYPNPNSGKFNLRFNLPDKNPVNVSVLSMDGKLIYSENVNDFNGAYNKEIDISKNPKGIYFVRVEQNGHAQLKKIALE